MGLLFVLEDDWKAEGQSVDIKKDDHSAIIKAAKFNDGSFPLVRRLNQYYSDVLFDSDEVQRLHQEFQVLGLKNQSITNLLELLESAIEKKKGVQTIAD